MGHWIEVNTAEVNELDRKGISAYFFPDGRQQDALGLHDTL